MAGSASDYLENEILDHILSAATFTAPGTLYVGLATAAITDSTTGSTVTEPAGGSYARVPVTNNATEWPAASGGSKANANDIEFPQATGNWGTVTHWFIADALTNGNILFHGDLSQSEVINTNGIFRFPAGDLTIAAA